MEGVAVGVEPQSGEILGDRGILLTLTVKREPEVGMSGGAIGVIPQRGAEFSDRLVESFQDDKRTAKFSARRSTTWVELQRFAVLCDGASVVALICQGLTEVLSEGGVVGVESDRRAEGRGGLAPLPLACQG